jgi:hypothetical protein
MNNAARCLPVSLLLLLCAFQRAVRCWHARSALPGGFALFRLPLHSLCAWVRYFLAAAAAFHASAGSA